MDPHERATSCWYRVGGLVSRKQKELAVEIIEAEIRSGQHEVLLEAIIADCQKLRDERRELFACVRQIAREQVQGSLRRIIGRKLLAGELPLESVPILSGGPGQGGMCDVCERPLRPTHPVVAVPCAGETFVHLHADCFMLWDGERHKFTRVASSAASRSLFALFNGFPRRLLRRVPRRALPRGAGRARRRILPCAHRASDTASMDRMASRLRSTAQTARS